MPGTDRVPIMKKTTDNKPLEIAWLGRGGQGVVTACQTLTKAALLDGEYSPTLALDDMREIGIVS